MPYNLSSVELSQLDIAINSNVEHPYAAFYRTLADIGEAARARGEDIDKAAIIWLRGAAMVNENVGSNSAFIRAYNKEQSLLRYGQAITDAEMDAVSDRIALQVFTEVVSGLGDIPAGTFPTIDRLAENDAQPAAERLFNGDAGGWAGNPLFLALGYDGAARATFNCDSF